MLLALIDIDTAIGLEITRTACHQTVLANEGRSICERSSAHDLQILVDRGYLPPPPIGQNRGRTYTAAPPAADLRQRIQADRPATILVFTASPDND